MTPTDIAAYRATFDPDAWAANIARDPGADGRVQILVGAALAVRALCAEVGRLQTERDRLARILAVERGDESQAPSGWRWNQHAGHWFRRDRPDVIFRTSGRGWWHKWAASDPLSGHHVTALKAMEAADLARKEPTP